jgi:hypothetical protein
MYNLTAGTYTLTLTDNNGCTITQEAVVSDPPLLSISAATIPQSCPAYTDGSINLTVTGGTGSYYYYWSTGAETEDITGLTAGTYAVTVYDSHACQQIGNYTVGLASQVCPIANVTGTVSTVVCYNATSTIYVAGSGQTFIVDATGHADFIAGMNIKFQEGTKVMPGGYLHGKINPGGPWCSSTKMTEVVASGGETTLATELARFTLYPNPTNGNFTLVQKGDRTFGNIRVEVYSMSGEKILTESMIGEKKHEFRFSDMATGLYFVKVVADDYVETIKLVKTR